MAEAATEKTAARHDPCLEALQNLAKARLKMMVARARIRTILGVITGIYKLRDAMDYALTREYGYHEVSRFWRTVERLGLIRWVNEENPNLIIRLLARWRRMRALEIDRERRRIRLKPYRALTLIEPGWESLERFSRALEEWAEGYSEYQYNLNFLIRFCAEPGKPCSEEIRRYLEALDRRRELLGRKLKLVHFAEYMRTDLDKFEEVLAVETLRAMALRSLIRCALGQLE